MFRLALTFVFVSLTSGSAVASSVDRPAGPALPAPANSQLQLYPAIDDLLLGATTKHVHVATETSESNYMLTIAANTLGGALVGFLIGGAIYLLQDPDNRRPVNLAWWTGGGALVGVGAGVVQVIVRANRDDEAVSRRFIVPAGTRQVLGWTHSF